MKQSVSALIKKGATYLSVHFLKFRPVCKLKSQFFLLAPSSSPRILLAFFTHSALGLQSPCFFHHIFFLSVFFTDATLEADVAKGRRDWAFSERDKVVLERESIRTLCDKLRRERDR